MAGGCALNSVANGRMITENLVEQAYFQPAAGDAGTSLGAAALIERPLWEGPFLGYNDSLNQNPEDIAFKLLQGEVVPVINGRAEFGPRALGNRSLLCLPTDVNITKWKPETREY